MKISESEIILIVVLVLIGFVLYTSGAMKTTSVKTVGGKHTVSEDIDQSCTGNKLGSVNCKGKNEISCNHTNDCINQLSTHNVICSRDIYKYNPSDKKHCRPIFIECNDKKTLSKRTFLR